MKLIQPSVEILSNNDPYKMIEIAGRTCYKSEDKITEDSCKEFVQRMIDNGHTAMLEHGTVYLFIPWKDYFSDNHFKLFELSINKYSKNYSKRDYCVDTLNTSGIYITTNYRVLVENDLLEALAYLCEPEEFHEKRVSVRFICDRGVSHELVRHKKLCVA